MYYLWETEELCLVFSSLDTLCSRTVCLVPYLCVYEMGKIVNNVLAGNLMLLHADVSMCPGAALTTRETKFAFAGD